MSKKMETLIYCSIFILISCTSSSQKYQSYNINIQEIDCATNNNLNNIKNKFISGKEGLFEYDFKLKVKTIADKFGKTSTGTSQDSVSVSFIPDKKLVYYKFDLDANFLSMDSTNRRKHTFFKINPDGNMTDPIYLLLKKIKLENLSDTTFNGTNYKVYNDKNNVIDSLGEMLIQLFFIKDANLKTPFNINGRYPNLYKEYCFAGVSNTFIRKNKKIFTVISEISTVTNQQEILCKSIVNKILKKQE